GPTGSSGRSPARRSSFPSSTRCCRRRATSGDAKPRRPQRRSTNNSQPQHKDALMPKRSFILILTVFAASTQAYSFCVFYVAMRAPAESITVSGAAKARDRAQSLGVTIEAKYTVGEYDILILSAKQSNGLETWLTENGYTLPKGAASVLGSYIRQNMHFFVAK